MTAPPVLGTCSSPVTVKRMPRPRKTSRVKATTGVYVGSTMSRTLPRGAAPDTDLGGGRQRQVCLAAVAAQGRVT